ncbi:MAG: sulfurtransferase [Gammaproteobacteria bacterium]|nr:sulfurtransferase [Gammaproteobacteria bacterium]
MEFPLVVDAHTLEAQLDHPQLRIIDLTSPANYQESHLPGAIYLDYAAIVQHRPPIMGLLPDLAHLERLFGQLGIGPETHVVAYDNEGGGKAARLLWTLEATGHTQFSLLNGGLHTWFAEQRRLEQQVPKITPLRYRAQWRTDVIADRTFIQKNLQNSVVAFVDTRTPDEYHGSQVRAARGGHIPGAVNIEWTEAMNRAKHLQLKPAIDLKRLYTSQGITPDKDIVLYCHSHHRSAFSYIVLKSLGYTHLRGYPGSWSDWGNQSDTLIAV